MKKTIALLLSCLMLFALLAGCAGSKTDSGFTWTREGSFEDADGNYLLISQSQDENDPGWYVLFMEDNGEDMIGGTIQPDGEALRGSLLDDDSDKTEVTITEEGENGLLMEVKDGETYHFTMMDVPEVAMTITINTEGLGQIAYAPEGEEPEFDDEYPAQSAQLNLPEAGTYILAAKADEGWKFVKWTKDGADYSTDAEITVEFTENADFVAVFESE